MRLFPAFVSGLIIVSSANSGQPSYDVQRHLMSLEKEWNEAHVQSDAEKLGQLWADELIVTVQAMPVLNKSQSVGIVRSGRVKFSRYDTSDVKINVFGNSAVVTGRLNRIRERQGKQIEDNWRFTKVYILRDGKWQVVAWHGSQAAK